MLTAARLLVLGAIVLTGCHTAHRAAVTTFRVIDTPARYVRERIDPEAPATTTTTTQTTEAGTSDVVTPGRPVTPPSGRPSTAATERTVEKRPSASPRSTSSTTRSETAPATTQTRPTTAPPPTEFPTARPVPGKPGFVYSIDPKGGMVDITGYKSGDKAKDPYTHQIFIVP